MDKRLLNIAEDVVLYKLQKHAMPVQPDSNVIVVLTTSLSIFFLTGLGLMLFGLFEYLRITYTTYSAFIGIGSIILALSTICVLVALNIISKQERKLEKLRQNITNNIEEFLTDTTDQLFEAIEESPEAAIALAAASGLAIGQKV